MIQNNLILKRIKMQAKSNTIMSKRVPTQRTATRKPVVKKTTAKRVQDKNLVLYRIKREAGWFGELFRDVKDRVKDKIKEEFRNNKYVKKFKNAVHDVLDPHNNIQYYKGIVSAQKVVIQDVKAYLDELKNAEDPNKDNVKFVQDELEKISNINEDFETANNPKNNRNKESTEMLNQLIKAGDKANDDIDDVVEEINKKFEKTIRKIKVDSRLDQMKTGLEKVKNDKDKDKDNSETNKAEHKIERDDNKEETHIEEDKSNNKIREGFEQQLKTAFKELNKVYETLNKEKNGTKLKKYKNEAETKVKAIHEIIDKFYNKNEGKYDDEYVAQLVEDEKLTEKEETIMNTEARQEEQSKEERKKQKQQKKKINELYNIGTNVDRHWDKHASIAPEQMHDLLEALKSMAKIYQDTSNEEFKKYVAKKYNECKTIYNKIAPHCKMKPLGN